MQLLFLAHYYLKCQWHVVKRVYWKTFQDTPGGSYIIHLTIFTLRVWKENVHGLFSVKRNQLIYVRSYKCRIYLSLNNIINYMVRFGRNPVFNFVYISISIQLWSVSLSKCTCYVTNVYLCQELHKQKMQSKLYFW